MMHPARHSRRNDTCRGCGGPLVMLAILALVSACRRGEESPPSAASAATGQQKAAHASAPPAAPQGAPPAVSATTSSAPWSHVTTRRQSAQLQELVTQLDPASDGWETEQFQDRAGKRLKKLAALLLHAEDLTEDTLAHFAAEHVQVHALRPGTLQDTRGPPCLVRRGVLPEEPLGRGLPALAAAMRTLAERLGGVSNPRVQAKIFQIDGQGEEVVTRVAFQIGGTTPEGSVQHNAVWRCTWTGDPADDQPRLVGLAVEEYEEVVLQSPEQTLFVDITGSVLPAEKALGEQLGRGLGHWVEQIETQYGIFHFVRYGMAVGDVNGDGLDDAYLCQPGGLPNRLLMQNPDGTAIECAADWGVDFLDHTSAALLIDLDNDGDQDLVLAGTGKVLFLSNEGQRGFQLRFVALTPDNDLQSMAAADYDGDGRVDVYVTCWTANHPDQVSQRPFRYHDAEDGGANVLLRNEITADGAWQFTDVTDAVGLGDGKHRLSLAAAWEDYDNDGDPDLYVANDFGPNYLYCNDGGRFVNVAPHAGVEDFGSGMSVSWADFNHDGRMDLYVGNMWSSAGNCITPQPGFKPGSDPAERSLLRRFAKGNTLFAQQPDGQFRERTAGVELGRWAWSSLFVDVDNDAWEDLIVANGYITGEVTDDL